jgi:hypothetical protein
MKFEREKVKQKLKIYILFIFFLLREKFGLYYVNFTSPQKERIAKESSRFMKKVIKTMVVPDLKPQPCEHNDDE